MNGTLELTVGSKHAPAETPVPANVDALDTAKPLSEIFQPFNTTLEKWTAKAASLVVTSIEQKTEMQQARLARLELKEARVTMDKTRKGLVEGLKARTSKIDATARVIREKMEALEEQLKASEEFAERHAEKVKAELKLAREKELLPFLDSAIVTDLSALSEEDYAKTLADAKLLRQAKLDVAARAEAEQKAKAEAERIERERIAAENERLKAEAAEAARIAEEERKRIAAERAEEQRKAEIERQRLEAERAAERKAAQAEADRLAAIAKQERDAIEAKARAEAEAAAAEAAKLRAELEAKARAEATEKARLEAERLAAEKAAKKAAAAPDKAKLEAFAETIRALPVPALSNPFVTTKLTAEIASLAAWIDSAAENL